ncbi:OmpA family protein [Roseovarius sp. E0-M6]|uniref:OmpA family protein n=1 Tax=Roseovarius sp. E0-M6 TaxID=3127118 RepID=UPI00300FE277
MTLHIPSLLAAGLSLSMAGIPATAQQGKTYGDGSRGEVFLPLGDLSFADRVVSHTPGTGKIKDSAARAEPALGAPDFSGDVDDGTFLSLGCDGSLVLEFTDNALVELEGPDLYVFEVGPKVEGLTLAISADGVDWTDVGAITGGTAEVDIAPVATADTDYRFARITDDGLGCGTSFAGADIDAVAAIGSAMRFTLDASVLFAVDSDMLRPAALSSLDTLAHDIAAAGISKFTVIGHTDASGSAAYNMDLSLRRAKAVRSYLADRPALSKVSIKAVGRGESQPVADNDTDAGRQMNRRVEIIAQSGS